MGFLKKNSTDPAVWPAIYSKHVSVYARRSLLYRIQESFYNTQNVISVSKL